MIRLAAYVVALTLGFSGPGSAEMADDARIILDAGEGQVRKWSRAPIVAVIYSGDFPRDLLESHLEQIRKATGLSNEPFDVRYLDLTGRSELIVSGGYFTRIKSTAAAIGGRGTLSQPGEEIRADIFVVSLGAEKAVFLHALTGLDGGSLLSSFARNSARHCFYQALSRKDEIMLGFAFIGSDATADVQAECIYEEVIQAFGLLNDSQDTPYFTLDNLAGVVEKNYDFELLSALYDPSVPMGGRAIDVVQLFLDRIYPDNRP